VQPEDDNAARDEGRSGGNSKFRIQNSEPPAAGPAAAGPVTFLVMELIEGRSLDKLIPDGGFDFERFLELATPLAEAISAAHDKSVIHRDLKPSNVMVDGEGRVKVLDFGLAKLQESEGVSGTSELPTEALTGVGTIVGTVPYMSPEQVEGKTVDHRTDIFSLGVLLYEMATGERPFSGSSQPALMSSILRDVPSSVVEIRDDLPRHLGRVISRCLEKDRRDRYQTARDVFNELKALRQESSAIGRPPSPADRTRTRVPRSGASSSQVRRSDVPWIAVLPLGCPGGDAEIEAFADGLEEDIASGLSRFSYLFVVARKSTRRYRGEATDVRQVGEELGARYVMEGGIRRAGSRIRIGMNLIDAGTGTHLWSETYDRNLDADDVFELQDEITDRVVATVADPHGALTRSMAVETDSKPPESLTSHEAILRLFLYRQRISAEDHLITRAAVEAAAERDPNNAEILAAMASLCIEEANHDFNSRPDPLRRALALARQAVEADPASQLAHFYLAQAYFHSQNPGAFRSAANRALELNRRSTDTMAMIGIMLGYSGDWERGTGLVQQAMDLNTRHPGWYRFSPFMNAYRQGRDAEALEIADQINMPEYWADPLARTVANAQLGNRRAAEAAARDLLRVWPDFEKDYKRVGLDPWVYALPELEARIVEGLAKAGLKVLGAERPQVESTGEEKTGTEPERGPVAIAVLPFTDMSPEKDQDYFCEGMAEEIINALTRLPGLRVIARTSAFRFRGEQDLRKVGAALGVETLLEGSVRKAGQKLRITAQLIDVADDSHIWSERFDRELVDVFAIQDEIAAAIVEKLHVSLGASEPARRQTANVAAYEALLEGRHHFSRFTPESTERALVCFRRALTLDPEYPDALAFSAFYHLTMAYMFANPREMLPNTRELGERALRVDPHHGEAQAAVAVVSVVLDHDWSEGEVLFRKALELAPASARVHELYGLCWLLGMGRFDEALAELDLAIELDPLSALYAGNRGRVLTCARRFDEAQASCRRGLTLDSRQLLVQVELAYALLFDKKLQEAIAVGERAVETHGPVNAPCQALALSYALAGRRDEAFELVGETARPGAGYRSPLALGLVHAAFDEMDAAFACIDQSLEERDPLLMYLAVHPMFDTLRGDPRYSDLLRRTNLAGVEGPTEPETGGTVETVARSERRTVGRLSELESLRGALEEARNGRGSLMCVAGEPGIGKTTLVEEFLAEAVVDGGCTVARGRSSERIGGSDAYLPILEALDSLLQSREGEAVEPIIKRAAPAWYAQISPLSEDSDESLRLLEQVKETTQERLKLDFVACVQDLSQSRPLILFLDDLHWADESTVDLLSFLAGKFEGSNVLVVVTYRPSDMQLSKHPFLQIKPDLQTRGVCREIQLGFLHEAEIAEYLDLEFPGHGFPPEFPALIHEKTEGSPLFMADLVRYLRDQGAIGQVDGGWRLIHGLPEIERQLPESVLGMIERKIGQLDEADHELLTVASVQGYEFDSAIAARVLGISPEVTEERLEDLERVHAFVTLAGEAELPDRTLTLRYRFVHVLYQNSLYGSLKPTRRARLSREVGEALETAHGRKIRPVAHELAALFEVGRDFSRAAKYYLMAAGQANAVFAHREAATLAHQGLGMVERLDPSPERSRMELELQLALGLAMRSFRGFGHPDTGTAYKRARALCHEIGDAPQLFPVLFGLWEFFQNQGDLEAAVDVAEQMLGLAGKGDDQGLLVAAHSVMADNLVCIGDPVPASEHAARALALYEPDEHRSLASLFGYDSAVSAHSMGALALWLAGYPDHAIREATAGATLANTFSDPATQAFGPLFASWIRQLTGFVEEGRVLAERCVDLGTEFEMPMFRDFGRVCQGWASIAQGEIAKGTEWARTGVDRLQAIEFGWARSFTLGVVAQGCAGSGRYDEALAMIERAFDHANETGEHFNDAELHRLKGEFLLSSEPLESERCFLKAIEVAQRQQAKSWELRATMSLARLRRDEGRIAEAHERLEQTYSWFTEGFETSDLKAAKALLEELNAALREKGEEPPSISPHCQDSTESKSIVVLPFANLSPDADTEYFSDGLTDEIITDLSRVRALRVISRSSAMRLKGDPRGLAAIGRDLGCRFVLEGSVRRSANDLRITARLVDAPNDAQLWADKYAGTLDDVFDFQERVSRSIVDALEIRMTPQEEAQLAERPIDDVRAQESYLRARNEIWSFMPGGLDLAISHLESALELIGDNALIYQGLGEAYFQYVNIGAAVGREEEFIGNAEDCVDKIFALEPESPRGHLVRAQTQMARGEIHACAASLQRVLMAYPNEVMALALYTHVLGWLGGKPDVAAPVAARLATVDPLNPMSLLVCAMVPLFAGRFSEAVDAASRMFALDPVTPVWRSNYVMALCYARRFDEAESLTEALKAEPDSDVATWQMGLNRAAWREDRAEVLRLADGPYRQVAEWDAEIPWFLATAHAAVGANDEALHWLDRAIDAGMINYPFLSEHDWLLDNIRGESRFDQAMKRARREWERLDEVLP
ncbi:MAG TPA: AAA family ATPase, partial [Chondromyces sp.]|nr:AAA family ATPase [Chondromyces sp.]